MAVEVRGRKVSAASAALRGTRLELAGVSRLQRSGSCGKRCADWNLVWHMHMPRGTHVSIVQPKKGHVGHRGPGEVRGGQLLYCQLILHRRPPPLHLKPPHARRMHRPDLHQEAAPEESLD